MRLLFSLLFVLTTWMAHAQKDIVGKYTGKITSVVMNGEAVSKERHQQDFTFAIEKNEGTYVLTGKLTFDGGPAHHVIDLDGKKTHLEIEDGKIKGATGKGHISVKVFKLFSALNKDFNVTKASGHVGNGNLDFNIHVIIPDYKNGYKVNFTFSGKKD